MDSKIQQILEACKCGMRKKAIDPKGNGAAVRSLERGKGVSAKKIEEMYANVLAYKNDVRSKSYFKLKLNPDAVLTTEEKTRILKDAVANGVSKSRIEGSSHGIMNRLLTIGNVRDKTIDKLYEKLLSIFGYDIRDEQETSVQSAPERIRDLELIVSSLLEKTAKLEGQVKELTQSVEKLGNTPLPVKPKARRISGLTVTLKTDKVRGKSYKRWYAITKHNGKRRMIYIGKDISKAKQKIRQGLQRLRGGANV